MRDAREARDARAAGARIIDVKEPSRGSLGAADAGTWRQVRDAVGHGSLWRAESDAAAREEVCLLSAALGELLRDAERLDLSALRGYQFAKVGLAGCRRAPDWPVRWSAVLARLPVAVAPVAVAYADHGTAESPPPPDVLRVGAALGCRALLLDTFDKSRGPLFAHCPPPEVRRLIAQARDQQLLVVLAGSLSPQSLPRYVELRPDYLAVRGAVCGGERRAALDAGRVRWWVERLARA